LVHQKPAYSDYPVDYKVPDFGADHDMIAAASNIKGSEAKLGHKFTADFGATAAPVNPRGYTVPNFGIDRDIEASLKNLKDQESIHGNWNLPSL